jgi:hypothetical protein
MHLDEDLAALDSEQGGRWDGSDHGDSSGRGGALGRVRECPGNREP